MGLDHVLGVSFGFGQEAALQRADRASYVHHGNDFGF
jgi:hypothetical protein